MVGATVLQPGSDGGPEGIGTEVLEDGASSIYGSDAIGGVVNVITKKPAENAVHTTLKTSFGNNSTENYSFYNEGKEGKVFWTAEAGKEYEYLSGEVGETPWSDESEPGKQNYGDRGQR